MRFKVERVPDATVHDVPVDEEKRPKCPVTFAQVSTLAKARSIPNAGGIGEVSLGGHSFLGRITSD